MDAIAIDPSKSPIKLEIEVPANILEHLEHRNTSLPQQANALKKFVAPASSQNLSEAQIPHQSTPISWNFTDADYQGLLILSWRAHITLYRCRALQVGERFTGPTLNPTQPKDAHASIPGQVICDLAW
jgi:hypothetical protein